MSERITTVHHAADNERFTAEAFDGVVGQRTPVKMGDQGAETQATIVGAQVAEDGRSVSIVLEIL